jgi:hypothetical protein
VNRHVLILTFRGHVVNASRKVFGHKLMADIRNPILRLVQSRRFIPNKRFGAIDEIPPLEKLSGFTTQTIPFRPLTIVIVGGNQSNGNQKFSHLKSPQ